MKLTPTNIHDTVKSSMFTDAQIDLQTGRQRADQPEPLLVQSVMMKIAFHPTRLEAQRENVKLMLRKLHPVFGPDLSSSFLNFCALDSEGDTWGQHRDADALIALGLGLKLVEITPKSLNALFPGGVPLVTVLAPAFN